MVKGRRVKGRKTPVGHYDGNDVEDLGSLKFNRNSVYEPSDSEDDYTDHEKLLLENVRSKPNHSHPKKHAVMDLPSEDDDYDDDEDVRGVSNAIGVQSFHAGSDEDVDSDLDRKQADDMDDLPDQRAWGKSRKNFYSTDYVDQDYGGFDGEDAEVAELEEQEARAIQQRLAAELDDTDFTLDVFTKDDVDESKSKLSAEIIKTDLSQLTSRQKLSLLQKEAPELVGIVSEFRDVMSEILKRLRPAMSLLQEDSVFSPELKHYVRTKYYLANNYALNMGFYLLLRARRLPVAAHPVVKRLLRYRQLLLKLVSVESVASAMLDEILKASTFSSNHKEETFIKEPIKQHLKMLSSMKLSSKEKSKKTGEKIQPIKQTKKIKNEENGLLENKSHNKERKSLSEISKESERMPWENTFDEDNEDSEGVPWNDNGEDVEDRVSKGEEEEDGESKRAITWEMAKNKGLTARRKKEDRNPRVKHRNKFRKAKIRRKGQVREPRKELQRYGGELSGIKATVSKSIKLK